MCDHTQSLCATIEAIFLHGLKDSFLWQTLNILTGVENAVTRRPTPTFWAPLMVFSHKYAIEQIYEMQQLKNEIGYCRCWIRQSLNDCLLSSYISNMRKNASSLRPYYRNYAFVRDAESLELAESLIGGIEACVSFQLPLNSSLLNYWPDLPLQLSGLYTPSIQTCPIASAVDVVNFGLSEAIASPVAKSSVQEKPEAEHHLSSVLIERSISIPKPLQANEFFADSIHNSPLKESTLTRKNLFLKRYIDVEEAQEPTNIDVGVECESMTFQDDIEHDVQLTAFLERVDAIQKVPQESQQEADRTGLEAAKLGQADEAEDSAAAASETLRGGPESSMGNSIIFGRGWSSTEENEPQSPPPRPGRDEGKSLSRSSSITVRSQFEHNSYNSLLRRHKGKHELFSRQIDFNDVWQRFESSLGLISSTPDAKIGPSDESERCDNEAADSLDEFEFVQAESISTRFKMSELREMVHQTFKIPREQGLASQNFACQSCGNPLGVGGSGYTTTQ